MAGEVTAEYVRARWAYSELLSCGHGHLYQGRGVPELKEKARGGVRFDELDQAERRLLADQLRLVRGIWLPALDGVASFKRVSWTRDELAAVCVFPYFAKELGDPWAPVTFKQWIEAEPNSPVDKYHARYAAVGAGASFTQEDPATVGRLLGHPRLIDGYHRAVRFWRANDPAAVFAVYLPCDV